MTKKKKTKVTSNLRALELVDIKSLESEGYIEAASSVSSTNPTVAWAKFILTDSQPNENKQRVPFEEFDNLITSGLYMPLKMAMGEIEDGHDNADPLGVITNLKQEGDEIFALAAMWAAERPEDIQLIKDRLKEELPVEISWEILYGKSSIDDKGIESIYDLTLKAATIVGVPAYNGRTPIVAVAGKANSARARKWSESYLGKLKDESFLYVDKKSKQRLFPYRDVKGNVDVKRLKESLSDTAESSLPENVLRGVRVRAQRLLRAIDEADASITNSLLTYLEDTDLDTLQELTDRVKELEDNEKVAATLVTEKSDALEAKTTEYNTLLDEVEGLREFKASAEKEEAKAAKLIEIKGKFETAGLNKDKEYFVDNEELLLDLSEASLDFLIQELVAFANKADEDGDDDAQASKIPNFTNTRIKKDDVKSLAEALVEYESKK